MLYRFLLLFVSLLAGVAHADTINYSYDPAGRLTRVTGNGTIITYVYDKAGNLLNRIVSAGPAPIITDVQNGASFLPGIAASSWITIKGSNLAATTRTWSNGDFNGSQLPTDLDGVSASVNGKPAYVGYVSPTQLNVLSPDDATTGSVQVKVTSPHGASNSFTANEQQVSPAFFLWPGNYVVATRTDFSWAVKDGEFPGLTTVPAGPNEVIIFWGSGFGRPNPVPPDGMLVPSGRQYNIAVTPTITIGGLATKYIGGALAPGLAGVYQLAVQVPALADGDWPVMLQIGGVSSPTGVLLTVKRR